MKTVLAAAMTLCLAFAGHAAELQPIASHHAVALGCIQHSFIRVSDSRDDQASSLGCAQFLSTSRVVQSRHLQHT